MIDPISSNKKSQDGSYKNRHASNGTIKNGQNSETNDAWILADGYYQNGKIIATVPKLTDFDNENLTYLVDVALNGQQFTGKPVNFRYYDVKITSIEPKLGPSTGGTNVKINGKGLYDAGVKRIKFSSQDGKGIREVVADWDKKLKCLRVTVPAFKWLFAEEEENAAE